MKACAWVGSSCKKIAGMIAIRCDPSALTNLKYQPSKKGGRLPHPW